MLIDKIDSFAAFCTALRRAGFSLGGTGEGIFTLADYFAENLEAHTGDGETDPWAWRIRAVTECDDLAYGKLFFNKGGWIAKEWYPYFLAVRRQHKTMAHMYSDGLISHMARAIYDLVAETPHLSLQELKNILEQGGSSAIGFEATLTMLQMKMFITISGQKHKLSKAGKEYGWPVTTFCTVEEFFGEEVINQAHLISQGQAVERITRQILTLNPGAAAKTIAKFIGVSS